MSFGRGVGNVLLRRQAAAPWLQCQHPHMSYFPFRMRFAPYSASSRVEETELRTISQSYTKIRYGPLRMGVTAKLLRRLTAPEALAQAHFSPKKGGAIAYALIDSICAVAKRKYGLLPEELMVDRCFVTQGPGTKRVKIMGRGRSGLKFIRSSHLNVTLKEIDFEAMIAAAESKNAKRKWAKMRDDAAALRDKEGNSETGDEKGSGNAATDSNTTS